MWCPDDIGRESWDWVGPPAWERACFNSPEWGGGSSPVESGASPDCIIIVVVVVVRSSLFVVVCVLLFVCCVLYVVCCVLWLVLWCWCCVGGVGADVVYATCLCRCAPTHATNSGGRIPGSQAPGVPATRASTSGWTEAEKCRILQRKTQPAPPPRPPFKMMATPRLIDLIPLRELIRSSKLHKGRRHRPNLHHHHHHHHHHRQRGVRRDEGSATALARPN